jgi:iron(III) transport system permease protein
MGILVVCNIVHFYTVSFLTATTALKQMDREFEAVSLSLAVPFYKTFLRVTAPVCLPAILEITMYYFVNSMATVSGVIFLYSADLPLASVAVANMDDAGDIASAAAMSVLIVLANMAARLLYGVLTRGVQKRTQAWIAA